MTLTFEKAPLYNARVNRLCPETASIGCVPKLRLLCGLYRGTSLSEVSSLLGTLRFVDIICGPLDPENVRKTISRNVGCCFSIDTTSNFCRREFSAAPLRETQISHLNTHLASLLLPVNILTAFTFIWLAW